MFVGMANVLPIFLALLDSEINFLALPTLFTNIIVFLVALILLVSTKTHGSIIGHFGFKKTFWQ